MEADLASAVADDCSLLLVQGALKLIDRIVVDEREAPIPSVEPLRELEMMPADGMGADRRMCSVGVPYEVLLRQRAAGLGWRTGT